MHRLSLFFKKISRSLPSWKYLIFGLLLCAGYSFAANVNNDSDALRMIVQVLNLLFTVITFLLTPAIVLAGWLLSPDWTMGDFFGLRPYFVNVWVLVSNLVYIIFAMMLLWMAVMQIFSSESNYAFKKKLPRFLVGIMIVPFTWLIVSWTLSFANQAVAAVLSIPMGAISSMQSTDESKSFFHNRVIPTKFVLDFAQPDPGTSPESVGCDANGQTSDGTKCISPAEFVTYNQSGPFFIIMIYAYDIFKIQETQQVNFSKVCGATDGSTLDAKSCITSIGQLLSKFGVAFITTLFFAIILIALCWVLLARAFKLWIYVMFSPLFGLAYAVSDEGLGKTLQSEGGSGEGVSLGEVGFLPFFRLAMVPVLVSAVLAFGLLFIGVINNTFTTGALTEDTSNSGTFCTSGEFMVKYCITKDANSSNEEGYSSRIIIGDENATAEDGRSTAITFEFGDMMSGFVGNSAGSAASGTATAMSDIFAHIILSLIALAVMWMGVKAAVSYDEVTKMAFEPFRKFGDSVGNFVQNIPSYLPTPHPAFAALNPETYTSAAAMLNKNVEATKIESRKSMEDMLSGADSKLSQAADKLQSSGESLKEVADAQANKQVKDFSTSKTSILTQLNRVESTIPTADKAKFTAFKNAVTNATSNEELDKILDTNGDHKDIVTRLESGELGKGKLTGIARLGSSSNTSPGSKSREASDFSDQTITAEGKIINKTSSTEITKTDIITPGQKDAVKNAFKTKTAMNTLTSTQLKDRLVDLKFNRADLDKLNPEQLKNVATTLADTANLPSG